MSASTMPRPLSVDVSEIAAAAEAMKAPYPVRVIVAAQLVAVYDERGPLNIADSCRAVDRETTDRTVRNALGAINGTELVAYDAQDRVYGRPHQIAGLQAKREVLHRLRLQRLASRDLAALMEKRAPGCQCGGPLALNEDGDLRCFKCGHRSEEAA